MSDEIREFGFSKEEEGEIRQALENRFSNPRGFRWLFEIIWKYLSEPLTQYAEELLGDNWKNIAEPEDIVSEVFLELHSVADRFFSIEDFDLTFLWKFLKRCTLNVVQSKRRRMLTQKYEDGKVVQGGDFEEVPSTKQLPADEILIAKEELQFFRETVSGTDSKILELRMQGHSLEEISNQLEMSSRRVHRVISSFRNQYEAVVSNNAGSGKGSLPLSDEDFLQLGSSDSQHISAEGKSKEPEHDPVNCTVYAPPKAVAGDSVMVQVMTHLPSQDDLARALALEFDEDARRRGLASLEAEVKRGSQLVFRLTMPGLNIDESLKQLIWRGTPNSVQFAVDIPADHALKTILGSVVISLDQIPLGRITFKLKVVAPEDHRRLRSKPTGTAEHFESYFVSYASKDRDEVLKRVQMLTRLGKEFFQDVLHLDAGDRWENKLYMKIDESDAVLLFWSSNARASEWVMRECRYTIDTKGIDHLVPVIIEGPPPVEPPPELEGLHLNDPLLYVMEAERNRKSED